MASGGFGVFFFLDATAVTCGWNGYQNEAAQKVNSGEEKYPAAPAGDQQRNPLISQSSDFTVL